MPVHAIAFAPSPMLFERLAHEKKTLFPLPLGGPSPRVGWNLHYERWHGFGRLAPLATEHTLQHPQQDLAW